MTKVGEVSSVEPPWIAEESWFDAVTATPDTIRAALSAGDGAHLQKRGSWIRLANGYDRIMIAVRRKRGWAVQIARVNQRISLCAVHKGSGRSGSRIKMSPLRGLFKPLGECFTSDETEKLMIEFLDAPAKPASADWVDLEWR